MTLGVFLGVFYNLVVNYDIFKQAKDAKVVSDVADERFINMVMIRRDNC